SSPTTRKTNGVRDDRVAPAVAAFGPRRVALTRARGWPDGRGWPGGRGRPVGRGGAAGRGRGGAGRTPVRPRAVAPPGRGPTWRPTGTDARGARPWPRLVSVTTSVCPLTMSPSRHGPPRARSHRRRPGPGRRGCCRPGDGPARGPGAGRSRRVLDAFGGPEPGRGGSRIGCHFRAGWPLGP